MRFVCVMLALAVVVLAVAVIGVGPASADDLKECVFGKIRVLATWSDPGALEPVQILVANQLTASQVWVILYPPAPEATVSGAYEHGNPVAVVTPQGIACDGEVVTIPQPYVVVVLSPPAINQ